ncbi:MAG: MFS transporter [Desulfobulbaceae bacterium]|uniref:MFS transporter n=1 Tax=Candidatus Desulfatifera sulfidica TaxID=2841691 RepID=A0A8J6TDW5_9BACT|nr:MFS transporter [Candidatus Desulfatifera sulfidica]
MAPTVDTPRPVSQSFSQTLGALIFLAFLFFLNFNARVIFAPLLPGIGQEYGLDHGGAGSFFLLISFGYFLSILASPLVAVRLGHKLTIVLSVVSSGLVLILPLFLSSILSLRLILFSLGLAAGLYLPSALATITTLVAPAWWGRGMAIHELAPNLGFVAAPLLVTGMLMIGTWQQGLALLGLVMVACGLLYGIRGQGGNAPVEVPDLAGIKTVVRRPAFWLMMFLFSLGICSTIGIYAMLPLYLVAEHNLESDVANRLLAMSRMASVVMPLAAGWLGDRFGNRLLMASVLFITALLTLGIAWSSGAWVIFFVFVQPLIAVCFFPSGFAILAGIGNSKRGNLTVSLCIPTAFLVGGGGVPMLIGELGDILSIGTGIAGTGLLILVGSGLAFVYAVQNSNNKRAAAH